MISFVWSRQDKLWMDNYEKLRLYKSKHGHCRVPQSAKGDRSFGLWVAKQRRKYINFKAGCKKDSLTDKQVALLDDLNFLKDMKAYSLEAAPEK